MKKPYRPLPPIEYLRRRLRLDHRTGDLFWKRRPASDFPAPCFAVTWNKKNAGNRAGGEKGRGYRMVRIDSVAYLHHRLVFALAYGYDPGPSRVDHLDGRTEDSRPKNLQPASNQQNVRKRRGPSKRNTSGVLGVYWSRAAKKWVASIKVGGRTIYLGCFEELEDAAQAREAASKKHYGDFAPINHRKEQLW